MVSRKGWGTHIVSGMSVRGSRFCNPTLCGRGSLGYMGEIGGPQRMGHPHCVGDEREGLRSCNPTLCGTIGRVCRTDWRAAKDGAPTVSVRISFYMARPMYRFAVPARVASWAEPPGEDWTWPGAGCDLREAYETSFRLKIAPRLGGERRPPQPEIPPNDRAETYANLG